MKKLTSALACSALFLSAWSAQAQTFTPTITKTVGSGSDLSYFVLDFKDGTQTPSFAFGYLYNGPQTAGDILDALQADGDLTFTDTDYGTPPDRNRFFDSFTLGTHTESDAVDSLGYWSVWYGSDGQQWNYSDTEGADGLPLSNGSWEGLSWDPDYTQAADLIAPATPTATPEPAADGLFLIGSVGVFTLARRRRSRERRPSLS